MKGMRIRARSNLEGFARHVQGINNIARRLVAFLLVALPLHATFVQVVHAGKPALPRLKAETQEAFDRYVKLVELRNEAELKRGTSLLWVDGLSDEKGREAYAGLKRGEVKLQKLELLDHQKPIACPGGMIHHWIGIVFIPSAKLDDVLGVLEDYDRHSVYYAPDVERSKIESRDGDHFRVFLRFRRHKVITVVLNTEHEVEYFHDGPGRAHSRSSALRIAEVENAGKSDEQEKALGEDGGFLWRMETWWRMEERDGGVYVQSEVASLTRDIPTGLGWMIKPFVIDIPKESLTFTLEATRRAVEAHRAAGGSAVSCFLQSPGRKSDFPLGGIPQQVPDVSGMAVPSPRLSSFRGRVTDFSPQRWVEIKALEHLGEKLRVVELAKNESIRSIVNQIGHPGMSGSNDGQAASHGFRNGQAERVFAARAGVEIGGCIEIEDILTRGFKAAAL